MIRSGNTRRGPLALRVSSGWNPPAGSVFYSDFSLGQYFWNDAKRTLSNFSFTRSTTGTFIGSDGLVQTAAINAARIQYSPAGQIQGYLAEAAATNLALNSEDFTTGNFQVTTTVNTMVAPDGATTADTLTGNANVNSHSNASNSISFTSGLTYTMSVYVKKGTAQYMQMVMPGAAFGFNAYASFNLDTNAFYNVGAGVTARVLALSNGWYCISMTLNATSTNSGTALVAFTDATGGRLPAFNANGLSFHVWGRQIEEGSLTTSYIPTTASTITRAADSLFLSSLTGFGTTAGTIFVKGNTAVGATTTGTAMAAISNGGTTGEVYLANLPAGTGFGSGLGDATQSGWAVGTSQRAAYAFSNSTASRISVAGSGSDGAVGGTLNTGINRLDIGTRMNGATPMQSSIIERVVIYPTRLSNSDLDGLTS